MVKTALAVKQKKLLLNSLKTSSVCIQTQPPYFSIKNIKWPFHQSWHSSQRSYDVHDNMNNINKKTQRNSTFKKIPCWFFLKIPLPSFLHFIPVPLDFQHAVYFPIVHFTFLEQLISHSSITSLNHSIARF